MKFSLLFILLFCLGGHLAAQTDDAAQGGEKKKNSFTSVFYGDPGKAALYSLIVPGGGQFYNRRYWKVPIVWAVEGWAVYNLSEKYKNLSRWESCWRAHLPDAVNPDFTTCGTVGSLNEAFSRRQSARSARETAWVVMSVAHVFNVVEAFVDRHLINFDASPDLSYHNMPSRYINVNKAQIDQFSVVSIKIPLYKSENTK